MPPAQPPVPPAATQAQSFEFNKSTRVKEAKVAGWFAGNKKQLWLAVCLLALAAGGWLLTLDNSVGNLLIATGLLFFMLRQWGVWHLQNLDQPDLRQLQAPVALDQALAPDVLPLIKWPTTPPELWQALSKHWQWQFIIVRFGFDSSAIASQLPVEPAAMARVWQAALEVSLRMGMPAISAGVLTTALIVNSKDSQTYLASKQLSIEDLINGLLWQHRLDAIFDRLQQKRSYGGLARDWTAGFTPMLNRFANNLSVEVEGGGASHLNFHLHDGPAGNILTALAQPSKNSVALLGETGSGKTTLVYTLADALLQGQVPPSLRYHKVMSLNASVLLSQVHGRGELEGLVLQLLSEAVRAKNIILFLDDAQLFFSDDTGGVNLANILLPVLQGGRVRMIAAMRPGDWQKLIANNTDLAAIFNQQVLPSPTRDEIVNVMEDQVLSIEARSKTTATYQGIQEAYRLAERYISEQTFPGKGIAVLTNAANFAINGFITPAAVQASLENSLGVKVSAAAAPEKAQLLNLEEQLHQRMINQNYAVKVVSDALRRARAGVRNPNRPVGSFLFLGPTGVGKTELTKALADVYFGGREQVIRLDMSEYVRAQDTARLLEPSGQSSSNFLTQIRRQPFSVVLLDEVEKAHPDILNLMLQLLDEGRLTDTAGREASFRDAIIVATSNAGADAIRKHIEAGQSLEQFSDEFVNELINSQQFRPELINRFDEVVLFRPLTQAELVQVVALIMKEVNKTLEPQKVQVALTPAAAQWLVEQGFDPRLGARPMRRMVQRTVENVVAKRLLSSQMTPGATLTLDAPDLQAATEDQPATSAPPPASSPPPASVQ